MERWEPHTVTTKEFVDPAPVAALAALFDDSLPTPAPGDALPPLWHWVALPRWPVSSEIGPDLIFREPTAPSSERAPVTDTASLDPVGSPFRRAGKDMWDFVTDPTLLMRFSATTANAHRIHYDWPYATRVEGYPDLVVHGPLMTLALAEVLRLEHVTGSVTRLTHRNRAPLFCGQPAQLRGERTEGGLAVDLFGPDGAPRTTLTVELQEKGTPHA